MVICSKNIGYISIKSFTCGTARRSYNQDSLTEVPEQIQQQEKLTCVERSVLYSECIISATSW